MEGDMFSNAVNSGNVLRIRIIMKDSLLLDPTFEYFSELEKMSRNVKGLYDDHDGREFITDKSKWNDDYMNDQMVSVIYNFSHERLEHLKEVVRYLRPVSNKNNTSSVTDILSNLKGASKEINDVYKQKNNVLKDLKNKRNEAKRLSDSSKEYDIETIKAYQSSIADMKTIVSTGFGYYIKALDKGYKEIIDSISTNKQKTQGGK